VGIARFSVAENPPFLGTNPIGVCFIRHELVVLGSIVMVTAVSKSEVSVRLVAVSGAESGGQNGTKTIRN
jgi:hypothetical protein